MKALREAIRPTTFIESEKLSTHLGIELLLVSETNQHTGSFKYRAAYNTASSVVNTHLITGSSGNFGQALAYACMLLGKDCTVVMPDTSAKVKVDAIRGYGATVVLIDTKKVSRAEKVAAISAENPEAYVASPFDDKLVIDGNSTLGEEVSAKEFDCIVAPIGGGGLVAGLLNGLCKAGHLAEVVGAEPLAGNDAARSLRSGRIEVNESEPRTIADGARTVSLGRLNWEIIRNGMKKIIEVPDSATEEALRLLFMHANLKTEPTGALGLGAVISERDYFDGKKVCVVVSGGNVDPSTYCEILTKSVS